MYRYGIDLDSLNEGLYRGLMLCHQELGDHSEALQAYGRCRELLKHFLGVPPNEKTQALYHSVRERAAHVSVRSESSRAHLRLGRCHVSARARRQPLVQHCFADCDYRWPDEDPEQTKGLQSADRSHEGAQKMEPCSLGHQHRTHKFVDGE